jgi:hypothetical protein
MAQQIQLRNGTYSQWTSANTLLAIGEVGVETDTNRFKVGTGNTAWNNLTYSLGFTPKGAWSNATSYVINDMVTHSGSSYISILAGSNQNPATANTYWTVLAQAGTNGTNGANGVSGISTGKSIAMALIFGF